jgi:hypothetical protein
MLMHGCILAHSESRVLNEKRPPRKAAATTESSGHALVELGEDHGQAWSYCLQPPKTIRPNSLPRSLASLGSVALRKRLAKSRKSCCFRFSICILFSIGGCSFISSSGRKRTAHRSPVTYSIS